LIDAVQGRGLRTGALAAFTLVNDGGA